VGLHNGFPSLTGDDPQGRSFGTALVLEEFGNIIARGGAGVVIASQSGHRLPPLSTEQNALLAMKPVEELLRLPILSQIRLRTPFTLTKFRSLGTRCA
jgi:hypothetical protein